MQGVLADYVNDTSPMIPTLVVHCINEIEKRGLHEVRVSQHTLTNTHTHTHTLKESFLRLFVSF